MTDSEFLNWLYARLVSVYDESPNTDFVVRLKEIADKREDISAIHIDVGDLNSKDARKLIESAKELL